MNDVTPEHNWVLSLDLFRIVQARTGAERKARALLNKAARSGRLRARCKCVVREVDHEKIAITPPSQKTRLTKFITKCATDQYQPILTSFWRHKGRSFYEATLWKWDKGIFAAVDQPSGEYIHDEEEDSQLLTPATYRTIYYGVEFDAHGVDAVLEDVQVRKPSGGQPGPRNKKFNYAPVLAELQSMIIAGEMENKFGSPSRFGVQAAVVRYIGNRMAVDYGQAPPEGTLRNQARKIMGHWRRHLELHNLNK